MIIEITGAPGIGKSTLLAEAYRDLGPEAVLYSDELLLKHYKVFPPFSNHTVYRIFADTILLTIFLIHWKHHFRSLCFAVKTLLGMNERRALKVNSLRNIIFKWARFDFVNAHYRNKIVIFDEGLSHIPFNLVDYTGKKNQDLKHVLGKLGANLRKVNVIILVSDTRDVKHWLEQRGHRRIKNNGNYTLDQFVHYNNIISTAYREVPDEYFSSKTVLELDAGNNIQSLINSLEKVIAK